MNVFSDLSLEGDTARIWLIGAFHHTAIRWEIIDKLGRNGSAFAIVALPPIKGRTKKSAASATRDTGIVLKKHG
jgi:hypothetical protein